MEFDGKYSVPIFLYMKSKLYHGKSEFHGWQAGWEGREISIPAKSEQRAPVGVIAQAADASRLERRDLRRAVLPA